MPTMNSEQQATFDARVKGAIDTWGSYVAQELNPNEQQEWATPTAMKIAYRLDADDQAVKDSLTRQSLLGYPRPQRELPYDDELI